VSSWVNRYGKEISHAVHESTKQALPLFDYSIQFCIWVDLKQTGVNELDHLFEVTEIGEFPYEHMQDDPALASFQTSALSSPDPLVLVVFYSKWQDGTYVRFSQSFSRTCGSGIGFADDFFNRRYNCEWWRNVEVKVGVKKANDMKSEYKMTTFCSYLNSFMVKK
jgi:hypothetical protein